MPRLLLLCSLALLIGIAFVAWWSRDEIEGWIKGIKAEAPPPEDRQKPAAAASLSNEEELVKAFVIGSANDPKSVEFAKWGPHRQVAARQDHTLVRVQFRMQNEAGVRQVYDWLVHVERGKAGPGFFPNLWGDDWINQP